MSSIFLKSHPAPRPRVLTPCKECGYGYPFPPDQCFSEPQHEDKAKRKEAKKNPPLPLALLASLALVRIPTASRSAAVRLLAAVATLARAPVASAETCEHVRTALNANVLLLLLTTTTASVASA